MICPSNIFSSIMLCCSDKFSLWKADLYSAYLLSCWRNLWKSIICSNSNHLFYKSKRKTRVYHVSIHNNNNFDEILGTIFLHWCDVHDFSWCKVFFSSLSQYLLGETCCKNYAHNDGKFIRKEVKLLSVRHNL